MRSARKPKELAERQLIEILEHLRAARALMLRDAEAFHQGTLTLERIAHILGANVGMTLAGCRTAIVSFLDGQQHSEQQRRSELFDTVLRARNMAIHGGAWIRHHGSRLVDLFLMLEHAIVSEMEVVEQIMVRSPLEAKPWQLIAHARNDMLSNSFSALPISISVNGKSRWMLLRDEAIVRMISGKSRAQRDKLLSKTIETAANSCELRLSEAETVSPRDPITILVERTDWPQLVIDENGGSGRLVGIVTPFDLL